MKLVIDISEELKEAFVNKCFMGADCFEIGEVLEKGIPVQNKESESISKETARDMLLEIKKTDAETINKLEEKVEIQEDIIKKQNKLIEVQEQKMKIQEKIIEKEKLTINVLKELVNEEL